MQKITPFLWFDNNAGEAANFYISIFKNSKMVSVTHYGEAGPGPEGAVMSLTFQLEGQEFSALNGGPLFKFTPAISLFVNCGTEQELDGLWAKLTEGGSILMGLAKYPFSEKFGWTMDKFGVSWQLNLASAAQKIMPYLMFVGEQHGKAEEAMSFYISLFPNSRMTQLDRYGPGGMEPEGTIKHATFMLDGQEFKALDSSLPHPFTFTPAISFFVNCEKQAEIDELWEKLSADGGTKGRCGWLTDKYGVSWQIIPTVLGELLQDKDTEKSQRVMKAMLQMNKLDIKGLQQAYEQS